MQFDHEQQRAHLQEEDLGYTGTHSTFLVMNNIAFLVFFVETMILNLHYFNGFWTQIHILGRPGILGATNPACASN